MSILSRVANWQFSLRTMLIAVTIAAVALALGVFGLLSVLVSFLLRALLPTVAAVCAVYARGDIRAFAIGAFVSLIPVLIGGIGSGRIAGLVAVILAQLLISGICGVVAVAVRRWLVGQGLADGE
jgi:hypothetical protein